MDFSAMKYIIISSQLFYLDLQEPFMVANFSSLMSNLDWVNDLFTKYWFRLRLIACSAPSHHPKLCWNASEIWINMIFFSENIFEKVVYKMPVILIRPQSVNIRINSCPPLNPPLLHPVLLWLLNRFLLKMIDVSKAFDSIKFLIVCLFYLKKLVW